GASSAAGGHRALRGGAGLHLARAVRGNSGVGGTPHRLARDSAGTDRPDGLAELAAIPVELTRNSTSRSGTGLASKRRLFRVITWRNPAGLFTRVPSSSSRKPWIATGRSSASWR